MPNSGLRNMDATAQLVAANGTFYMEAGEDTNAAPFTTSTWHMLKGVFCIKVIEAAVIAALEEGAAVSVLAEGTAVYPGQRVTAETLPAGTELWAVTAFTRISVTSGKIICLKGGKTI